MSLSYNAVDVYVLDYLRRCGYWRAVDALILDSPHVTRTSIVREDLRKFSLHNIVVDYLIIHEKLTSRETEWMNQIEVTATDPLSRIVTGILDNLKAKSGTTSRSRKSRTTLTPEVVAKAFRYMLENPLEQQRLAESINTVIQSNTVAASSAKETNYASKPTHPLPDINSFFSESPRKNEMIEEIVDRALDPLESIIDEVFDASDFSSSYSKSDKCAFNSTTSETPQKTTRSGAGLTPILPKDNFLMPPPFSPLTPLDAHYVQYSPSLAKKIVSVPVMQTSLPSHATASTSVVHSMQAPTSENIPAQIPTKADVPIVSSWVPAPVAMNASAPGQNKLQKLVTTNLGARSGKKSLLGRMKDRLAMLKNEESLAKCGDEESKNPEASDSSYSEAPVYQEMRPLRPVTRTRRSLSTPRRDSSHIRMLDFTSPRSMKALTCYSSNDSKTPRLNVSTKQKEPQRRKLSLDAARTGLKFPSPEVNKSVDIVAVSVADDDREPFPTQDFGIQATDPDGRKITTNYCSWSCFQHSRILGPVISSKNSNGDEITSRFCQTQLHRCHNPGEETTDWLAVQQTPQKPDEVEIFSPVSTPALKRAKQLTESTDDVFSALANCPSGFLHEAGLVPKPPTGISKPSVVALDSDDQHKVMVPKKEVKRRTRNAAKSGRKSPPTTASDLPVKDVAVRLNPLSPELLKSYVVKSGKEPVEKEVMEKSTGRKRRRDSVESSSGKGPIKRKLARYEVPRKKLNKIGATRVFLEENCEQPHAKSECLLDSDSSIEEFPRKNTKVVLVSSDDDDDDKIGRTEAAKEESEKTLQHVSEPKGPPSKPKEKTRNSAIRESSKARRVPRENASETCASVPDKPEKPSKKLKKIDEKEQNKTKKTTDIVENHVGKPRDLFPAKNKVPSLPSKVSQKNELENISPVLENSKQSSATKSKKEFVQKTCTPEATPKKPGVEPVQSEKKGSKETMAPLPDKTTKSSQVILKPDEVPDTALACLTFKTPKKSHMTELGQALATTLEDSVTASFSGAKSKSPRAFSVQSGFESLNLSEESSGDNSLSHPGCRDRNSVPPKKRHQIADWDSSPKPARSEEHLESSIVPASGTKIVPQLSQKHKAVKEDLTERRNSHKRPSAKRAPNPAFHAIFGSDCDTMDEASPLKPEIKANPTEVKTSIHVEASIRTPKRIVPTYLGPSTWNRTPVKPPPLPNYVNQEPAAISPDSSDSDSTSSDSTSSTSSSTTLNSESSSRSESVIEPGLSFEGCLNESLVLKDTPKLENPLPAAKPENISSDKEDGEVSESDSADEEEEERVRLILAKLQPQSFDILSLNLDSVPVKKNFSVKKTTPVREAGGARVKQGVEEFKRVSLFRESDSATGALSMRLYAAEARRTHGLPKMITDAVMKGTGSRVSQMRSPEERPRSPSFKELSRQQREKRKQEESCVGSMESTPDSQHADAISSVPETNGTKRVHVPCPASQGFPKDLIFGLLGRKTDDWLRAVSRYPPSTAPNNSLRRSP
ncbi:unnamed protein product [Notodromas monacha]|uniref:LisH domain-containing protein n=1 Tax=Notodromas monacha TaxID=399045 RepID=A0A7R9BK12_9CRUS|nr:unnamed protein product [Notodromas monacha]CAG0915575.1 unnamed protein product [Notodromas monacha]